MIPANELRIGNWVQRKSAHAGFDYQNWQVGRLCSQYGIDPDVVDGCMEADDGKFLPIPLTPEILEKCGFVLQPMRQSIYVKGRLKISSGIGHLAYLKHEDNDESYYIGECQYLHQLQNLHFALTGKELEVKL